MAASLTLTSATPNALKYLFAADGSGAAQNAFKTKAELLADAITSAQGPSALVALLSETFLDVDWAALAQEERVSLYVTATNAQTAGMALQAAFTTLIGPAQRLTVAGVGLTNGDTAIIELRFNHSYDR